MFSKFKAQIIQTAFHGGIVAATVLAALAGTGAAHADGSRPCSFYGRTYSSGAVLHINGTTIKCVDGRWQEGPGWERNKSHGSGHDASGESANSDSDSAIGSNAYEQSVTLEQSATDLKIATDPENQPSQSNTVSKNSYRQSVSGFH